MTDYSAFHWSEKARKYAETLGTIFNVKGRVNTVADLPATGNKIGDVYLVGLTTDTDLSEYAWLSFDGTTRWERLGYTSITNSFSALTGSPYDNTSLATALNGKQATISDLAAIRSGASAGATALQPSALNGYATESWVNNKGYITGITSAMVTTALGYTPVNPTALATVATSGAYSDLSGKPTIPTVNNPTITLTQGGTTKGSFTLNQSSGATIDLDAGGGGSVNTFDLFDHKWSDYQLNDQSWLRADTFSWQDGTVYSNAYNHLVADYNGGTSQTETVGSYTITYVLASDGHKITTDETTVANIYNESGVAWYYILDTTNQRFKLPRELPITDKVKGNGITLGLNNGTENFGLVNKPANFYGSTGSYGSNIGTTPSGITTVEKSAGVTTDQTKSGIISHRANENGQQYLYFYVGQFSQSATEQTAGLNSELFNGKADIEALNNKIQQVSTLPVSPVADTLYLIPE